MSLSVTSLASGSSGNALLLRCGADALLVDCGIPLRALEGLMRYQGAEPASIRALVLTHEHGDHAFSAAALARRYKVPVLLNSATRAAMGAELDGLPVEELPVGQLAAVGPFEITSFRVAHDAADPVGLRVRAADTSIAVAIDLGSWDERTVAALRGADLIVAEANHDRELLRASPYPWTIQERIFGPRGHLDNVQCGELLARACGSAPCDVWLAHLSEQTNTPKVATAGVRRVLALAGATNIRLGVLPRRSAKGLGGAPTWRSEDRMLVQQRMF
jgi:phosphoribosyl 1,2-cyclic phosphodiesterase